MPYDLIHRTSSGSDDLDEVAAEKHYNRRYQPYNRSEGIKLSIQIYSAVIATFVCVLLFINLAAWHGKSLRNEHSTSKIESIYSKDRRYMTLDPEYDQLWKEMFPNEHLEIKLPDEDIGEGDVSTTISMFHQLHCLSSFRTALQDARNGKDVGYDWRDSSHWPHCLDYMRQTILCFADGTFERPPIINGSRANFIDGTADLRQCRSTEPLYSLFEMYT